MKCDIYILAFSYFMAYPMPCLHQQIYIHWVMSKSTRTLSILKLLLLSWSITYVFLYGVDQLLMCFYLEPINPICVFVQSWLITYVFLYRVDQSLMCFYLELMNDLRVIILSWLIPYVFLHTVECWLITYMLLYGVD
jgi:hypothetical protein